MATTAACPAFAYVPPASAPVVERLIAAGAVLIGKTNLDYSLRPGWSAPRSPLGTPRNPFGAGLIPGGSSSGSAVAVAAGLASFALGTDTAGSGRVPAAFNNIVGLKPTRGLVSTRGVVPACRSLDCVSIFALTVEDALAVLEVAAAFDADDPVARPPQETALPQASFRFGVPAAEEREFFGDDDYARLYDGAIATLAALGGTAVEVPFAPLRRAAALLYGGPWLAERLDATEALRARDAQALLPVTRAIIERGRGFSALDAHRASYELDGAAARGRADVARRRCAGAAHRRHHPHARRGRGRAVGAQRRSLGLNHQFRQFCSTSPPRSRCRPASAATARRSGCR